MPLMRLLLSLALFALLGTAHGLGISEIHVAELPREARATLVLIERGGPFPYRRDDIVFGNHEHRLPAQGRGYYREYTVPAPDRPDRGPKRIVAGRDGERYYSDDHYRSFRRIVP